MTAAVPDPRRCGKHCPHLTASTSDRCGLPRGHDGQHVAPEPDGSPKYTWHKES